MVARGGLGDASSHSHPPNSKPFVALVKWAGVTDRFGQTPRRGDAMTQIPKPTGHVVLASADSESYRSLRRKPMPRAERIKLHKIKSP